MPVVVQLDGNVSWRAFRDPNCNRWVAICDSLGLATDAETWVQLQERTAQHLSCLFDDLLQENKLDAFLRSHGWGIRGGSAPVGKDLQYDIPIELMIERDACSA